MTDTLKLKNGLVMPSNFIEVKDYEMEYLDGGWNWKRFAITAAVTTAVLLAATALSVFTCGVADALLAGSTIAWAVAYGGVCVVTDISIGALISCGITAIANAVINEIVNLLC